MELTENKDRLIRNLRADTASYGLRVASCLIDLSFVTLLLLAFGFALSQVLKSETGGADRDAVLGILAIIGLPFGWAYYIAMDASRFQGTLGKMRFGLKITDLKGAQLTVGTAFKRQAPKIFLVGLLVCSSLLAGIAIEMRADAGVITSIVVMISISVIGWAAYLAPLWTPLRQTWFDRFAGCVVVRKRAESLSMPEESRSHAEDDPSSALAFYEQAWLEVEDRRFDLGLWSRCFVESGGDESKCKAVYIRQRVHQLLLAATDKRSAQAKDNIQTSRVLQQSVPDDSTEKKRADRAVRLEVTFGVIFLGIIATLIVVFLFSSCDTK